MHRPHKSQVSELAHFTGIKVSGVLHCSGVISIVSLLDHRVKQFSKYLEGSEEGEVAAKRNSFLHFNCRSISLGQKREYRQSRVLREQT